ncbi:hypothetical protein [Roseicyclus persicicus]|uniref:Uncharacterized protein n=1 Tax=Roseicyclus persicicus TaxID=2650661 RepID=A0A7X6K0H8_9RHOB|nr:hypothetical protein [Roseibacterium persicicum]NKX45883.1 hypothetical protein [Roseibacterium persicicum]
MDPDAAPGIEALVVATALPLAALLFPLAALVFAAVNLRRGTPARVLFGSALVSSALALVAGLVLTLLPGLRPEEAAGQDWQGYAITFVYAWALLDFWRGARLTGARPRAPALVAAVALAAVALVFVLVAT